MVLAGARLMSHHFPITCAACGAKQPLTTATDGSDAVPTVGDLSVCHDCEAVLRFTATGTVLQPLAELDAETLQDVAEARAMVALVKSGAFG